LLQQIAELREVRHDRRGHLVEASRGGHLAVGALLGEVDDHDGAGPLLAGLGLGEAGADEDGPLFFRLGGEGEEARRRGDGRGQGRNSPTRAKPTQTGDTKQARKRHA